MAREWRWLVMALVACGHVAIAFWLSRAMTPLPRPATDDVVLYVEWIDMREVPEPRASEPPARQVLSRAPVSRPRWSRPLRAATAMEAVIDPPAISTEPEPRVLVAPERDPFHRLPDPQAERFGRRSTPTLREPDMPRLAGERPPDAPLPELQARGVSPKQVAGVIGGFIGGGPDAPVEAPCGGRVNGGAYTADSFSPAWQQQHGCGDTKERGGYDGTVELPPGVRR